MKKFRIVFLVVFLLILSCVCSYAASTTETQCADALYELGLFKGTGTNADGTPIYSLDKTPTRAEAITMLVRLLGKEEEAKAQDWETPFTDVEEWAKPYVGYAYNNGLTTGTSATTFGSTEKATETQYLTFILRALGYSDTNGDFNWDEAKQLTNKIGITSGDVNKTFQRGDIAEISYKSLFAKVSNSDVTLLEKLRENGAIKETSNNSIDAVSAIKPENESIITYGDFTLKFYDDVMGYVLTKYSGNTEKQVVIPNEVNGYPIVEIGSGSLTGVNDVYIPNSVNHFISPYMNSRGFANIALEDGNTAFKIVGNCLLSMDGKGCVAFFGKKDTDLIIPDGVIDIAAIFGNTVWGTICIPASVNKIGQIGDRFIYAKEFVVDEDNYTFSSENGVLYNKDKTTLCIYPKFSKNKIYIIPDTVSEIEGNVFNGVTCLEKVFVPQSVSTIKNLIYVARTERDGFVEFYCEADSIPAGWIDTWYGQYDYKTGSQNFMDISQYIHWGSSLETFNN